MRRNGRVKRSSHNNKGCKHIVRLSSHILNILLIYESIAIDSVYTYHMMKWQNEVIVATAVFVSMSNAFFKKICISYATMCITHVSYKHD